LKLLFEKLVDVWPDLRTLCGTVNENVLEPYLQGSFFPTLRLEEASEYYGLTLLELFRPSSSDKLTNNEQPTYETIEEIGCESTQPESTPSASATGDDSEASSEPSPKRPRTCSNSEIGAADMIYSSEIQQRKFSGSAREEPTGTRGWENAGALEDCAQFEGAGYSGIGSESYAEQAPSELAITEAEAGCEENCDNGDKVRTSNQVVVTSEGEDFVPESGINVITSKAKPDVQLPAIWVPEDSKIDEESDFQIESEESDFQVKSEASDEETDFQIESEESDFPVKSEESNEETDFQIESDNEWRQSCRLQHYLRGSCGDLNLMCTP
jgi:hypothetical protein